ncbi:MAG: class I SAM-dependent methyltransferase [Holosporaceae bacterium]|jgi:SAM-dependent methyltransferase
MKDFDLFLDKESFSAWNKFIKNENNIGHVSRISNADDLRKHITNCMESSRSTISRIKQDIGDLSPKVILEIGCSAGTNCLALQEAFPEALVIGIEPEKEAIAAAQSLHSAWTGQFPYFLQGVGELVALPSQSVDLIVCHTVIEHVSNVPDVIQEIARILKPSGIAHLEAPNYLWPYEPHLEIWTIPKLGKGFVSFCARVQGRSSMIPFLKHLQFVTPFQLEHLFLRHGLTWHNRMSDKIMATMNGQGNIKKYKFLSKVLELLGHLGLTSIVSKALVRTGVYPSVLYTLKQP